MVDKSVAICTEDVCSIAVGEICLLDDSESLIVKSITSGEECELGYKDLLNSFYIIDSFSNIDIKLITEYKQTLFKNYKPVIDTYVIPSHICLSHYNNSKQFNNKSRFIKSTPIGIFEDFDINTFYHTKIYAPISFICLVCDSFLTPYSYEVIDWIEMLPELIVPNIKKFNTSMDYQMGYIKLLKSVAKFSQTLFNFFIDFIQENGFRLSYNGVLPIEEQECLKVILQEINRSSRGITMY